MKRFLIVLLTIIVCGVNVAVPVSVYAASGTDLFSGVCQGSATKGTVACSANGTDPVTGSNGILRKATRIVSIVGGMVSGILIIVGGFMYGTAGGDSGKVSTARNTIIGAAIGLLIIGLAQAIVLFVTSKG